jgi:S1-C subfamily serine protease
VVVRVVPGSPAAAGGLLLGDRIVAIDGGPITNQADMLARLAAAGPRVVLDVERRGRIASVSLEAPTQTGVETPKR